MYAWRVAVCTPFGRIRVSCSPLVIVFSSAARSRACTALTCSAKSESISVSAATPANVQHKRPANTAILHNTRQSPVGRASARLYRVVLDPRILRRLRAFVHAVVAQNVRDSQPVVREDRQPSGALSFAMLRHRAPAAHGCFVTPERERQNLARRRQALEPLDREEAVDVLEQRPQARGHVQICILAVVARNAFENHGDHRYLLNRTGNFPAEWRTCLRR